MNIYIQKICAKKNLTGLILWCCVSLTCSCANDVANRYYLTEHYPPKKVNEVQVLQKNPDEPYIVMADFQARGISPDTIRKEAAQIGADAVIITTLGGYYANDNGWVGQGSGRNDNTYSRIVGTAIKFKINQ